MERGGPTPFGAGGRCGRFFLSFGRTMGSAIFGRRIRGWRPPLGVRPGVCPGVRSAGEALILAMKECLVSNKTRLCRCCGVRSRVCGCHKEEAAASAWFTQSGSTIITTDALSVVDHCDNRGQEWETSVWIHAALVFALALTRCLRLNWEVRK